MGCSSSKTDDLPLVIRCRERRELIRAAANHRYALAAAHVSYFRSLKDVGDALRRFVDEELVAASPSPSPAPITPPFSKLDSEIHSCESLQLDEGGEEEESHLSLSDSFSSTDDDGEAEDDCHRRHHHDVEKSPFNYAGNVYYMKKSAPPAKSVVSAQPRRGYSDSYWNSAAGYGGDGGYFTMGQSKRTPPPPSPKGSPLGFLNLFDMLDGGYVGVYSTGDCDFSLNSGSPDLSKVREREGIPELEEETEDELCREALKGKRTNVPSSRAEPILRNTNTSSKESAPLLKNEKKLRAVPLHNCESGSRSAFSRGSDGSKKSPLPSGRPSMSTPNGEGEPWVEKSPKGDMGLRDEIPRSVVSKSLSEGSIKKKGVNSELERRSNGNGDSSKLSSVTVLSPHEASRDLRDVVAEIREDFELASGYGKEVAMLLEAGKVPYQPSFCKAILSRILYLKDPWVTFMDSSSIPSITLASRSVKLAKSYFEDVGKEFGAKAGSLSSTLDKLYAWEKKLYREVQDEEELRIMYEKQRKRLKILHGVGAKSAEVYAAEVSSIRLLTKLDVCIKAIHVTSSRINKLRDEELLPKIIALIQGMIRMWKAMLRCHQKQFKAISDSKMQKLRVKKSGSQSNSSSSTITKLENELRSWRHHFNDWISFQKSYIEFLNGWLLQFHQYEPEAIPYSPSKLGAPPIFVICNDWLKATEAISDRRLSNAMDTFSNSLQKLWGKEEEEKRQRLKAEYVSKNYEKLKRTHHRIERKRMKANDVKYNLDSLKQRLAEERTKHKDAMKLVQNAASRSFQEGLVPVFKELESFTSKALIAHEQIRLQHPILR